ncbi:MAG: carboxylesterase/lipase family protein [Actinobacteria bacterium]|nr:carboxylesterase/lipase family protein [Actinomycetota bacterium]
MSGPLVETRYGRIRGVVEPDGVRVFRGVPYGRCSSGPLRFRPPQPPVPWAEALDASRFGPLAPQLLPERPLLPDEPTSWDENCLSLNVWTPGLDGGRRPVLVWLHGGSFLTGSGAGLPYRGHHLARKGDVVVVTLNYRLGTLGFLAHPDLRDEETGAAGNWGLLDQLCALQWVAEHAAAFGGDAANVTLFGESAGSMCVSTLLGANRGQQLFRRAIAQSGGPIALSVDSAAETAELLVSELGLEPGPIARLRDVPAGELVQAQARLARRGVGGGLPLAPVVDGGLIDRPPLEGVRAGRARHVSLLAGSNRDEMTYFVMGDPQLLALDDEGLRVRLEAAIGPRAGPAVDSYRAIRADRGDSTSPLALWCAIQTDWIFRMPMLRMVEAQAAHTDQTYAYLFTWPSPLAGGLLGACHGLEVPFVFGSLTHPAITRFTGGGSDALELAEYVQQAWLGFARAGDPSVSPARPWPAYDCDRRSTMVLGAGCFVEDDPLSGEREFWESEA